MPFDATPSPDPTVTLIDAMLACYVDETRWTKGCLSDGNGGRCISGAARHIRRTPGIRGDRLRHFIALSLRQKPGEAFCGLPFLNDGLTGIEEVREVLIGARQAAARATQPRTECEHITVASGPKNLGTGRENGASARRE